MSQSADREHTEISLANPLDSTDVPPGIFLETEIEIPLEEFIAVRSATWQYRGLRNLTSDASAPRGLADFYLEPQEEGGFVAYSKAYPGAIGQGETELEALKDLYESIRLLKEVLDESRQVLSLKLAPTSGQEALKALQRKGFTIRKGRGSHVVVSKEGTPPFVVPLHHELKKGTLNHIVKSSGDFKEGFEEFLK